MKKIFWTNIVADDFKNTIRFSLHMKTRSLALIWRVNLE